MARLSVLPSDSAALRTSLEWCEHEDIALLVALLPEERSEILELLRASGFEHVGDRVGLAAPIDAVLDGDPSNGIPTRAVLRRGGDADAHALGKVAASAHRISRFYVDVNFADEDCDELYRHWIVADLGGQADGVLVADIDGEPVAYTSFSIDSSSASASVRLVGVSARHRRQGLASELVRSVARVCADRGVRELHVVTQGSNDAALALYARLGFTIRSHEHWLHCWRRRPAHPIHRAHDGR